jgi:hypothetical protein
MKSMKFTFALMAATVLMIISFACIIASPIESATAAGTRAGEVGWQYDTFDKNLMVNVTPEYITTQDQITVTVTSKIPEVWIKQASIYGVVYPKDGVQFPFTFPFFKISDSKFQCAIEPFPLNGYDIEFYIVVYDYFFEPLDSRSSMNFAYTVLGSGWRNETFAQNVELKFWPMSVNATEDVEIILISRNNVTIKGANLYVTYETTEGEIQTGGWNFSKTNVNSTEMRQTIPGYPAGTNITFWVTAWDQYNALMTSGMYNYSVMGIAEYTNFPFEYTGVTDDRSQWIPDDAVLLPMAGMCALGIPLFIYLYAINLRRRKRAIDMVTTKKPVEPKEVSPDE